MRALLDDTPTHWPVWSSHQRGDWLNTNHNWNTKLCPHWFIVLMQNTLGRLRLQIVVWPHEKLWIVDCESIGEFRFRMLWIIFETNHDFHFFEHTTFEGGSNAQSETKSFSVDGYWLRDDWCLNYIWYFYRTGGLLWEKSCGSIWTRSLAVIPISEWN